MQRIIMLTFRGNAFYFVDKEFSNDDVSEMQQIADDITAVSKGKSEQEIYDLFVETVKSDMGIHLEKVEISQIVRIHV